MNGKTMYAMHAVDGLNENSVLLAVSSNSTTLKNAAKFLWNREEFLVEDNGAFDEVFANVKWKTTPDENPNLDAETHTLRASTYLSIQITTAFVI